MSKESYFEMCEALGSEPIPEEIPVDSTDLAYETILAIECYGMLTENWSGMGSYLGKDLSGLLSIMELKEVNYNDREYTMSIIMLIDQLVSEDIARKQKQASKK